MLLVTLSVGAAVLLYFAPPVGVVPVLVMLTVGGGTPLLRAAG
jgi:hypothetical protein